MSSVESEAPEQSETGGESIGRRKWLISAVAVVVIALVAGLWVIAGARGSSEPEAMTEDSTSAELEAEQWAEAKSEIE